MGEQCPILLSSIFGGGVIGIRISRTLLNLKMSVTFVIFALSEWCWDHIREFDALVRIQLINLLADVNYEIYGKFSLL